MSKASQMRAKKIEGLTVGDIARLFGVTYHYAYQVVVVRAAARERSAPHPARLTAEEAAHLTWPELFEAISREGEAKEDRASRAIATREADTRDPSGKWESRMETWKKKH